MKNINPTNKTDITANHAEPTNEDNLPRAKYIPAAKNTWLNKSIAIIIFLLLVFSTLTGILIYMNRDNIRVSSTEMTDQTSTPVVTPDNNEIENDLQVEPEKELDSNWETLITPQTFSYPRVILVNPGGWTNEVELTGGISSYSVSFKKENNEIIFAQGATGVTKCIFSDTNYNPEQPFQEDLRDVSFQEIPMDLGTIRYYEIPSSDINLVSYSTCFKEKGEELFIQPYFGQIYFNTPTNSDKDLMNEITQFIQSISYYVDSNSNSEETSP